MKTGNKILAALAFAAVFITIAPAVKAQKKAAEVQALKNAIDSQRYTFYAQYAIPTRLGQRYLGSDYTFSIAKDIIISYLPYYGRAYSAPINNDGGIKFTASNFSYTVSEQKKGSWEITIQPKDAQDVRLITMTIFQNGSASLQVNSNNRDPINFTGYVETGVIR